MPATAYGMLYGAVSMFLIVLFSGRKINFDPSASYIFSMLYLAVFGSIIAFSAYLTIIGRFGADKAGNVVLAAPVLAVILSALFEHLKLSILMIFGILMVVIGNYVALKGGKTSN